MSHPGDEGWMLGYLIIESKPAKQRKHWQRSQLNRHPNILPLPTDVSNRFPPELIDRVIDHLQGDRKALSSCSLVCKAWLACSRYQLFGNAIVRLHNKNVPSTIASYVRHLEIAAGWFRRSSVIHTSMLLKGFVSTTSLRLRTIKRDIVPVITASLTHNFRALTELKLQLCTFDSFAQFSSIYEAFPLLQSMSLADVYWNGEVFPVPNNRHPPPHLRNLEFHRCDRIMAGLLSYERVPAISHLKLGYALPATVDQFLCALGPTLEHLTLCRVTHPSQLDLSQNHHLRMIRLTEIVIARNVRPPPAEWVTASLSQIVSRQVEIVAFHMTLIDPNGLEILDWDALEQILARPQFVGLRKMNFVVTSFKTKAMRFIKGKLSTYDSRGILHVTQCGDCKNVDI